jgi:outer membrane protein assembly factor BamB
MRKRVPILGVLWLVSAVGFDKSSFAIENWSQFRGPGGSGVAEEATPPDRWSTTENVAWVKEIPGRGWSSPIVWGKTVFVTSAISTGGVFKEPSTGIFGNDYIAELTAQGLPEEEVMARVTARDIELAKETEDIRYMVYAVDVETGKVVWEREAHKGKPFGGRHRKNTYASETPATDGERVFAYFGNVGLYCYSMEGNLLWEHHWEPQPKRMDFGTGSSPVVHGDHVYVLNDTFGESFIAAVDKTTGKELWRTPRHTENPMRRDGWSTPFVWENALRTEIIAVGHGRAMSYDTQGKELWRLADIAGAIPTPLAGLGMLFVATGSQGEENRPVFAVRPGASDDISLKEGEESNDYVVWHHPRASAYVPSPLLYKERLYFIRDNGILSVFDAKTGERLYRARIGGGGHTFASSPWATDGKVFFLSEDGDTFVMRAGATYEETGKNSLGEMSLASPAISSDSFFIRTKTKLYRISESQRPTANR